MLQALPIYAPTLTLPTVAALAALWREVAARPLWAPPHFWRYLGLRRRMHLRLLAVEQLPVVAPVGKVNDCSSCLDICCVGPAATVLLRLTDIARLIDIGRTELIVQQRPTFSRAAQQRRPALRRQLASRSWAKFPVLKQDSMGACAALGRDGRCGLYPHWPLACARFPYSLHLPDRDIFYSQRCQSFWVHPAGAPQVTAMAVAAVAAYNARIQDAILLAYAPERLRALGLMAFVA